MYKKAKLKSVESLEVIYEYDAISIIFHLDKYYSGILLDLGNVRFSKKKYYLMYGNYFSLVIYKSK